MSDIPKDYFKILGITRDDLNSPDAVKKIKKAYRRLARKLHPDANPNAPQDEMKDLNEAYGIFSDLKKLTQYLKSINHLNLDFGITNEDNFEIKLINFPILQ